MKPSELCKEAGLSGLNELSVLSGQSVQTLINWTRHKPLVFNLVLTGAATIKKRKSEQSNDCPERKILIRDNGTEAICDECGKPICENCGRCFDR